MVKLIMGPKGTGKTKTLVDLVRKAVDEENGDVICIEKDKNLTYDIPYTCRLIHAGEYGITTNDLLKGFLSGLHAGNYDITDILVDSTLKIGGSDPEKLASFIEKLKELSDKTDTNLVLSVSADKADIPARIAEFAVEI